MRLAGKHLFFVLCLYLAAYIRFWNNNSYRYIYLIGGSLLITFTCLAFSLRKKNDVTLVSCLLVWSVYSTLINEFPKYSVLRLIYLAAILLYVATVIVDFLFFRKDLAPGEKRKLLLPKNWF